MHEIAGLPNPGPARSDAERGSFLLTRGGALHRLERSLGLDRDERRSLTIRMAIGFALAFVPLVVLAALQGVLMGSRVDLPLVEDVTVYVRFAIAIPLLIYAGKVIDRAVAAAVDHFPRSGVLEGGAQADFDGALARLTRSRDSVVPEIVIMAGTLALVWAGNRAVGLPVSSWHEFTPGVESSTTWAGGWAMFISQPIFFFLLFRWLWRISIWSQFLWRVSRANLTLIPTHPDRAGGLAFLGAVQVGFGALLVPISATVAARGVQWLQIGQGDFESLRIALLVFAAILLAVPLGPLQIFMPKLWRAKWYGLLDYANLGASYTRGFDEKWLRRPATDPLLGSADIQSLADLGNSYEAIRQMRVVPQSRQNLISLALAAVLPMLPFILMVLPLEQLLSNLLQLIR